MKRFFRIIFSIIALVVVVAVVALGSLIYFIDPNKMRPVIVEEVMNRTGYQLAIYGKLNWRLFPVVGINVERMTLTAPDQLEPFMDLRNITIASKLSQLIHGNKNIEGDVRIADVQLLNIHASNASVKLGWQQNVLSLSPIKALLYGGTLTGMASGSNLNQQPHWDWDVKLDGVQLQQLLIDANKGRTKLNVSGKAHVEMLAGTSGSNQEQMLNELNGEVKFNAVNGSVSSIDINYLIRSAEALINKQPIAPPPEGAVETRFDDLSGNVTIRKGNAITNDVVLKAPAFVTKAKGSLNLSRQLLNISLQVDPSQSTIKWEIPVLITGSLSSPDVRVDMSQMQRFLAQTQLDKVKDRVRDEISKRVPGKAGEALQNLLGR
jgi:uncharacterized protein involved in outer membrane biogenesis